MTLYTYVPSKDELLDLMVDQVLGERELPGPGEPERRPTGATRSSCTPTQTRAMFRRHPGSARSPPIRPPIGPGMLAGREYLLSALSGIGLTPRQTNSAALAITTYVDSAAGVEADSEQLERTTGQTNDAWWDERNDLWETYFDVERHPTMTAIWNAGRLRPWHARRLPPSPTGSASTDCSTGSSRSPLRCRGRSRPGRGPCRRGRACGAGR